ncbi:MAG TPA: glycerophosphodiester phosphodiesterase, partial [Gemmatimonadaceae bacterium]|nr:glycerophosphodiester phosphodiesterase [Gemmatimonadaceae bacterium]
MIDLGVIVGSGQDWHVGLVGRRRRRDDVKVPCLAVALVHCRPSPRQMPVPHLPRLIAHRGLPRRHRENTLAGFLAATAAGADGWELDVHASRDGVVVVHHDPVLPAWAGALGGVAIASADWSTLAEATVGEAGERMPTLDAVLHAATTDCDVYVEIKARGIEPEVAAVLARHPGVRTAVHSFDHRVSSRIRAIASNTPTGILLDSYLMDPAHALATAGARDFWPH